MFLQIEGAGQTIDLISQQGVAFATLILMILFMAFAIGKLWSANNTKEEYIRESERENLKILNDLSTVIDKVSKDGQRSFESTKELINSSTQRIIDRISKE